MGNWVTRMQMRGEHPVYRLEAPFENLDHHERASKDRPGHPLMRIVDDVVIGYWLGFLISCTWNTLKFAVGTIPNASAYWRRPELFREQVRRLYWYRLRESAPMLGGVFATWGLVFTGVECLLEAIRGKDDLYNIMASAAASGVVMGGRARGGSAQDARARRVAAIRNGAFILVLISGLEGFGALMTRKLGPFTWWADADQNARFLGLDDAAGSELLSFLRDRRSEQDAVVRAILKSAAHSPALAV